jgi:hypothetical protein
VIEKSADQFSQFRLQLYQYFNNQRADTLIELFDALCSDPHPQSVVLLSLSLYFRRDHNSLYKAITGYPLKEDQDTPAQLIGPYLPHPQQRKFWLLGVDVTPCPRPHARRLEDRGYVYQPNPIRGNKPVTVGHPFSDVFLLPERNSQEYGHWALPLSGKRVKTKADKKQVAAQQIGRLLNNRGLPFYQQLCALVGDSDYSTPAFLAAICSQKNLVGIVRVRSNRVFSRPPKVTHSDPKRGRPVIYGKPFKLGDGRTWSKPDDIATTTFTGYKGKTYRVEIQTWHNLLMRGKREPVLIPMEKYPFTLLRIRLYNEKGKLVHKKPLWLIVIGEQRQELDLTESYEAYRQRYDMEHFFRFGKQNLLLDRFQTPVVQHEEKWWEIVHLAYLQLWLARQHACNRLRPWERYLPKMEDKTPSPAMVQRSFGGIIWQFGTPASGPKPRGNSPGRQKGTVLTPRPRQSVIYKG